MEPAPRNIAIVRRFAQVLEGDFSGALDLVADDFVWHYFNPQRPDLAGDYVGLDGVREFLERVQGPGHKTFTVKPVSLMAFGDELVVAHNRIELTLWDSPVEMDAVVVVRVHRGRIVEAWDIPAVNTVRLCTAA
jgi:uncharacterized protein